MKQTTTLSNEPGAVQPVLTSAFSARQPIRKGDLVLMSHDEVRRQRPNEPVEEPD